MLVIEHLKILQETNHSLQEEITALNVKYQSYKEKISQLKTRHSPIALKCLEEKETRALSLESEIEHANQKLETIQKEITQIIETGETYINEQVSLIVPEIIEFILSNEFTIAENLGDTFTIVEQESRFRNFTLHTPDFIIIDDLENFRVSTKNNPFDPSMCTNKFGDTQWYINYKQNFFSALTKELTIQGGAFADNFSIRYSYPNITIDLL